MKIRMLVFATVKRPAVFRAGVGCRYSRFSGSLHSLFVRGVFVIVCD